MSEPTYAPRLAGDPMDDDGQVIDSLLVEVDNPPEPLPDAAVDPQRSKVRPRKTGRLLTGTMLVLPTWNTANGGNGPVPILPADPDRKTFRIQVQGANAGDYILFADDTGKLQVESGGARLYATAAGNERDLDWLSGPLWIVPGASNNAAGVYFSWWSVTE